VAEAPDPTAATDEFLAAIPRDFARDHALLSQGCRQESGQQAVERVLVAPRSDRLAAWNAAVRLGRAVEVVEYPDEAALVRAIDLAYERHAARPASAPAAATPEHVVSTDAMPVGEDLDRLLAEADRDLLTSEGKAPLVKLVDRLLFTAIERGASDLHLQPTSDGVLVRMRIDGALDAGHPLPPAVVRPLVSRLKVLGRMDVADRLIPQDGRTTVKVGARTIDVRMSTVPTAYGERMVLRLLDGSRQMFDFASLGMPTATAATFRTASGRSSGIVLVTGPTGSGKTTTLYATLRGLPSTELNIMTIEDPIEYELSSLGVPISQSQVNPRKGITFANGLRHILRQDPDVIMVGEIRDAETARIAIQAALTGHLVFTTLHTNDAVSAITRLIDLGVEPYLVASSLTAVLAQRLVRTCCTTCSGRGTTPAGTPCLDCLGSGYRGRLGIFELLTITEALRAAINRQASIADLRVIADQEGMRSLAHQGADLVATGRTTADEIDRVVHHG
jgi:general secretion pathway protein E